MPATRRRSPRASSRSSSGGPGESIELTGRFDYVIHGAATTDPTAFRADPEGSFRDTIGMARPSPRSPASRDGWSSSAAVPSTASSRQICRGSPKHSNPASTMCPSAPTYAAAKRESERRFRAIDGDLRIARVFSLTGPYQDLGSAFAVPDLIRQAAEGGAIRLTGDGGARRSFCYATDLAAILLWLLLGEPRHDVYNVGSRDGTASIAEVAQTIAEIFGGFEVRTSAESVRGATTSRTWIACTGSSSRRSVSVRDCSERATRCSPAASSAAGPPSSSARSLPCRRAWRTAPSR